MKCFSENEMWQQHYVVLAELNQAHFETTNDHVWYKCKRLTEKV